jgi:folylpolyglutamate synthase/dihydropteroate synthase
MVSGHELEPFHGPFEDSVAAAYVVPIDFHRARDPLDTAENLKRMFGRVNAFDTIESGLSRAIEESAPDEVVLVTGSFYLVGETLRLPEHRAK